MCLYRNVYKLGKKLRKSRKCYFFYRKFLNHIFLSNIVIHLRCNKHIFNLIFLMKKKKKT